MTNGKKTAPRGAVVTGLLLASALALLALSGVQTARATLTYYSETYAAQVNMYDIGITLVENGTDVSWRNYTQKDDVWNEHTGALVQKMLADGEKLALGKSYPEVLTVRNSGNIDQYVRVNVSCYWLDAAGKKVTTLSPKLIHLNLTTNSGWVAKTNAATPERTTLYYTKALPVGQTAPAFSDTLTIDNALAAKVTETQTTDGNGRTTVTTTYDYNGVQFMIEAEADAVQTHNAADAIKSAWGVDATVASDGSLSLQ